MSGHLFPFAGSRTPLQGVLDWLVKVSDSTERRSGKGVGTPFPVHRESDPLTRWLTSSVSQSERAVRHWSVATHYSRYRHHYCVALDRNCRVKFVGTRGSRTRDLSVTKVLCIARYTHILAHPCFQHLCSSYRVLYHCASYVISTDDGLRAFSIKMFFFLLLARADRTHRRPVPQRMMQFTVWSMQCKLWEWRLAAIHMCLTHVIRIFLQSPTWRHVTVTRNTWLHRLTWRTPPSFRRIATSNGANPFPIGPRARGDASALLTLVFWYLLPACRHPSVESEASVTSLPAWCCTAHVRSMNWRMSVSVGAELGPIRSCVRRRTDEGKWGRRQAFTFIFGVCIHILDFLKLSVSSIVPTYFCFHFCFRHTGPVLNLRRLRCLRSGSYLLWKSQRVLYMYAELWKSCLNAVASQQIFD